MPKIETLYVANKTHSDIGFTDYQDICFRQQGEFIDQALDIIEKTADYPEGSKYRWVCEATGPLMRHLRKASPSQIERFRYWNQQGAIEVTALPYPHMGQMFTVEELIRCMYPVKALREEYGLKVETALQCDVTGVSWLYADLLPAIGVEFLATSINQHRALAPQPRPGAFWWQGPAGGKVLVWNGYHYLYGRSVVRLGDWRFVDRFLPPALKKLEDNDAYPYDFLYLEATHPTRVDNGPPDIRMADFARRWNEEGREPRIELTTTAEFSHLLRKQHGKDIETRRGDWTDWWVNGYGSTAYETAINRESRDLLEMSETIDTWLAAAGITNWDRERMEYVYDKVILGDELAWGAYSSSSAPDHLFSKSIWNGKQSIVYSGAMESHDVLTRAVRGFADTFSDPGPDGVFNLTDLDPKEAFPDSGATSLLAINTLGWEREVMVEEPEVTGNLAPDGMLDMYFPRDVPWGGERPIGPIRRAVGTVPAYGYTFIPLADEPNESELVAQGHTIENSFYRVRVDAATGSLLEWYDKVLDHDFAAQHEGWGIGQYVYETIDSEQGRTRMFELDFSREDAGIRRYDVPFKRVSVDDVVVEEARVELGVASIAVEIHGPGIRSGRCTFSLQAGKRTLGLDWELDKEPVESPESVFIAFPFKLGEPKFRLDLGGVPSTPDADQIAGAVRDWLPVLRFVAVSDGMRGVVMAPIDAPLVQLGGPTAGLWSGEDFEPQSPTILSWPMNNHWEVNFKSSQEGKASLRYRLTTHAGPTDDAAAMRYATEETVPVIVERDRLPTGPDTGRFLEVDEAARVLVTMKPGEEEGLILRMRSMSSEAQLVSLKLLTARVGSATAVSPIETADGQPLRTQGDSIEVPMEPWEVKTVRVVTA